MKKNKKLLLSLATLATVAIPVATVVSCGTESNNGGTPGAQGVGVFNQGRRTIVTYAKESDYAADQQKRAWDVSVQESAISKDIYQLTTTNIFRQKVTKKSNVVTDGSGKVTSTTHKQEEWAFDGVDSVSFDGGQKVTDINSVVNNFGNAHSSLTFTVPKGIKYVDSNGEKTKYNYKAIDFFYGFLRYIYSSNEVRTSGNIKGKATGLPKISDGYLTDLKNNPEWYQNGKLVTDFDNRNVYLINMFGIDIKETVKANTGNHSDDEFVVKFADPKKCESFGLSLFSAGNSFTPISSEKIRELNHLDKNAELTGLTSGSTTGVEPGKFLQLAEYGHSSRTNEVADLSDYLSVSRFYFNQYDTKSVKDGGTGVIVKKNEFAADTEYAQNNKTILKYVNLIQGQGDADTFNQERQRSFLADNSESILFKDVKEDTNLMKPIKTPKYIESFESTGTGRTGQAMINPYYMVNGAQKIDDNTSKLLFGVPIDEVNKSTEADDEYFFGRGSQFRALLNTSANLYSLSKNAFPASPLVKTSRDYRDGQVINTGTNPETFESDEALGRSVNSLSDDEASKWYSTHHDSLQEVLKPGAKFDAVKQGWKDFIANAISITSLGLTNTDKFTIPLYDYRVNDADSPKSVTNTYKALITYLNNLTKGTNVEFVEFDKKWGSTEDYQFTKFKNPPLAYVWGGADYASVSSLVQQLVGSSYGYTVGAELLYESIDDAQGVKGIDDKYGLTKSFDLSKLWAYIEDSSKRTNSLQFASDNSKKAAIKKKLGDITLEDWTDYREGILGDADKKALLDDIDNIFQNYFLTIASDTDEIKKWVNFVSGLNLGDKLALGNTKITSSALPTGTGSHADSYSQPWVHLVDLPTKSIGSINFIDLTIDEK